MYENSSNVSEGGMIYKHTLQFNKALEVALNWDCPENGHDVKTEVANGVEGDSFSAQSSLGSIHQRGSCCDYCDEFWFRCHGRNWTTLAALDSGEIFGYQCGLRHCLLLERIKNQRRLVSPGT